MLVLSVMMMMVALIMTMTDDEGNDNRQLNIQL